MLLRDRVDLVLVTRPSLSSLKVLTGPRVFLVDAGTDCGCCLAAGAALGLVGFATRDATFARGGRGILASSQCEGLEAMSSRRSRETGWAMDRTEG